MFLEHLDNISCYKLLIAPSLDNHSYSSVKSFKQFSDCDRKYQLQSCMIVTHVSLFGSCKCLSGTPFCTANFIITQKILFTVLKKSHLFHNVPLTSYWYTSFYGMAHCRKSVKHTQKSKRYSKKRDMGRFFCGDLETSLGYFHFINDRFREITRENN